MSRLTTVAVTGNLGQPSRTVALAKSISAAVAALTESDQHLVDISEIGPSLGRALQRSQLSPEAEQALRLVERADVLIVASPVYKGSYTGLFKHLFDFIAPDALVERPVVLAATGGSDRHALIIEHQLRPLFSFFRAHTVPTALYAIESDFDGHRLKNSELVARVSAAAKQVTSLLASRAEKANGVAAAATI
jgi:FMN reductase